MLKIKCNLGRWELEEFLTKFEGLRKKHGAGYFTMDVELSPTHLNVSTEGGNAASLDISYDGAYTGGVVITTPSK